MDYKEILECINDDEIILILNKLGGSLKQNTNSALVFPTVCHNSGADGKPKLYYYKESKRFYCYTDCLEIGNIFNLVMKVNGCKFGEALTFVAEIIGINISFIPVGFGSKDNRVLEDFDVLERCNKGSYKSNYILKEIENKNIIDCFQKYYTKLWVDEGINEKTQELFNIRYNTINNQIVIPHHNIENQLVGIRVRNLDEIAVSNGYKYMPLTYNNTMYSHSLLHNLYGINICKDAIKKHKKVVLVESEKGCLQGHSMFGDDCYIVALGGSNVSKHQRDLLLSIGVTEVILGLDKQFKTIGDLEYKSWIKKMEKIANLFVGYVDFSIMLDLQNLLGYKDSPTDRGVNIFNSLYKNRIKF